MNEIKPVGDNVTGTVGFLHKLTKPSDSVYIFQLGRKTDMLSEPYINGALKSLREVLPDDTKAIVIGCDVNVYELAGADATMLVLKGLI